MLLILGRGRLLRLICLTRRRPKSHLNKLLANVAVNSYVGRQEPEIRTHLEFVVNTVSMEGAVQQRQADT